MSYTRVRHTYIYVRARTPSHRARTHTFSFRIQTADTTFARRICIIAHTLAITIARTTAITVCISLRRASRAISASTSHPQSRRYFPCGFSAILGDTAVCLFGWGFFFCFLFYLTKQLHVHYPLCLLSVRIWCFFSFNKLCTNKTNIESIIARDCELCSRKSVTFLFLTEKRSSAFF